MKATIVQGDNHSDSWIVLVSILCFFLQPLCRPMSASLCRPVSVPVGLCLSLSLPAYVRLSLSVYVSPSLLSVCSLCVWIRPIKQYEKIVTNSLP